VKDCHKSLPPALHAVTCATCMLGSIIVVAPTFVARITLIVVRHSVGKSTEGSAYNSAIIGNGGSG
jgi:hypothetical protein